MTEKHDVVDSSTREGSTTDFGESISRETLDNDFVSIKNAKTLLKYKYDQYVRRLLLEGKLEGVRVKEKHFTKWYISKESIEFYSKNSNRSGKRRYIFKTDRVNEDRIREVLDSLNIDYEFELSYQKKEEK